MTATKLLDALVRVGLNPALDGPDVTFDRDPPPELDRYLDVLLTGVRALLMGRRWLGIDSATGHPCGPHRRRLRGPLALGALAPAAKLPRNTGLLIVEAAGERWDRLPPWALDELPECFEPEP